MADEGLWLNLSATESMGRVQAYQYDLSGQLVIEKSFDVDEAGSKLFRDFNNSNWSKGVYLLFIRSDKRVYQIKVVK